MCWASFCWAVASAVSYVLAKLADAAGALLNKAQELQGVRQKIERMQKELCKIQALLRDADCKCNRTVWVTEWVMQARDMAHRIEDVVDTFLVEIEENHPESSNWFRKLKNNYKMSKHRLHKELEDITQKLSWIYQRATILGIKVLDALDDIDEPKPSDIVDDPESSDKVDDPEHSDKVDDPEIVGLEADKEKIIIQLLDRNISRRTVLSIVGTGGLGKTTLAQKVYKSAKLEHFDCHAWLFVSQKFNLSDLLRKMLYSIKPRMRQQNPPVTDDDLPVELKSFLRFKRYLIVLDGVWTIDLWEQLKVALPDTNNASRVIITSRLIDVANAADCNTEPYRLRYLDDGESLALLFRKAFQQLIEPENYPCDLLEVAKRLTNKCDGLPLALVVLGGILTRIERNYTAWRTLEETMDWHNKDGMKCSQVLAMSYEDLPYDLKPCFLYFAAFPENYVISGKHVTKMWVAEGFIPEDGAGTMEDKADAYLEELVQRCLIQVTEKSWNGCCKYGKMHILLRDLAIHEAKEKNFFNIFSKAEGVNQLAARKPRRAALQFCTPSKDSVNLENTRSLLCFGFGANSINDSGFRKLNYSFFRLLRVLTIEGVDMRNCTGLVGLIHLRYLGFRNCTIQQELFQKISFYNLETIDLKGSCIEGETTDWYDVVIPNLRHVYGYEKLERIFPLEWDHHTNLQTLKSVGQGQVHSLECCINLRTLGISYVKHNEMTLCPLTEWQTLKGVLKRTEQLVSLSIVVTLGGGCLVPFGSTKDLPCHEKIQSLRLCGKWGRVHEYSGVEMFPTNLTKLTIEESRLQEDPMPIFERLQSLRILRLGQYSYEGTMLICSTGGFPNLEKLELKVLPKLCHWDIKEGAMPILSHLKIDQCDELYALPELLKVRTLQELLLNGPSGELQQRVQGKDQYKIEHIPYVRITTDLGAQPAVSKENRHQTIRWTGPSDSEQNSLGSFRPTKPSHVDDLEIVGLEDDTCWILNHLLDRRTSRRTVLSIVGTSGLGKTTLAQKVYKSAKLEGQFYCRVWLSISQKYNLNDLWREILYSVEPQMNNKNAPITDGDLLVKLESSLKRKRYLVVLDDVWDIDLWEKLKIALLDLDNASRVIITTRLIDVAQAADSNTEPYKLHKLNDDDSLALLFRKAYQHHIQPTNYCPDLLEVAKKMIQKCGGQPLPLVMLGDILRNKDRTYSTWRKVEETMDWYNEDGEEAMKILYKLLVDEIFIPEDGGSTMEKYRAAVYLAKRYCKSDLTEASSKEIKGKMELHRREKLHQTEIEEIQKRENDKNYLLKGKNEQLQLENQLLRNQRNENLIQLEDLHKQKKLIQLQLEKRIHDLEIDYNKLKEERDNAIIEAQELRKQKEHYFANSDVVLSSHFSLSELEQATQNFSDLLKIGEDGFGCVYKGSLRKTTVAIKKFNSESLQGISEFQQEVAILNSVRHPNIVNLIGSCSEISTLVYEFLPNGSLEDQLACADNTSSLTWQARIRIISEICLGLVFLHSNKPHLVIHGDLKPDNILLDANFISKLSNFGISKIIKQSDTNTTALYRTTHIAGTFAYIDPEFLSTGELTPKSDVYSFGIIVFRLLTGKRALNIACEVQECMRAGMLLSIVDKSAGKWPFNLAEELAILGLRCADISRRRRPDMSQVWATIEPLLKAASLSSFGSSTFNEEHVPSHFICPIMQEIMKNPCIAADGFTYEDEAIEAWLKEGHSTSPMTNLMLPHYNLIPNHMLRCAIKEWLNQHPQS